MSLITAIDNKLNHITMYRLVVGILACFLIAAVPVAAMNKLAFGPGQLVLSTMGILLIGWAARTVWSRIYRATVNPESSLITGLILALILTPAGNSRAWLMVGWTVIWAEASKYWLAVRGKHLFNPAAIAAVVMAFAAGNHASWWVGNATMAPLVLVGGFLIVRKLRREKMVAGFMGISALATAGWAAWGGHNPLLAVNQLFWSSSWLFLAGIMLTEPLTTPPGFNRQVAYAGVVGILFTPSFHIGPLYPTPELALVIGNGLSWLITPQVKLFLELKEKIKISPDSFDFIFKPPRPVPYKPGQFLEWTLDIAKPDSRGSRRYFTLASSPTEENLRLGVKFPLHSSQFKQRLLTMEPGDKIIATQLGGDFILPKNPGTKLVFLAGGIGITPFRSMAKFLTDRREARNIVLFYSAKNPDDLVYKEVFTAAEKWGLENHWLITDPDNKDPHYLHGRINPDLIVRLVPDWQERLFYISGPQLMVDGYKQLLTAMGLKRKNIKTDYFPGF